MSPTGVAIVVALAAVLSATPIKTLWTIGGIAIGPIVWLLPFWWPMVFG